MDEKLLKLIAEYGLACEAYGYSDGCDHAKVLQKRKEKVDRLYRQIKKRMDELLKEKKNA